MDYPSDADWRRGMLEPDFFAKRFLNVTVHDGQKDWLYNSTKPENLLVTGNRWGKSFVSALKLIHHTVYRPRNLKFDHANRYRAVTASITQDQANITFNIALRLIRQSEIINRLFESVNRTPYPKISFGNGSTIEARTTQNRGEYLLGNDYDLFIFDEVAFETVPEYIVEEVILMRLADREGILDLVSTPNGKNWFYRRANEIISKKRNGYFQSGDSRSNRYISRNYIDERVKYFSETRLKQNIMGQFVDSGGEILPGSYIDHAIKAYPVMNKNMKEKKPFYISGWDLARKQTATVGITIGIVNNKAVVLELNRYRFFDWNIVCEKIKQQQEKYPGKLIIDATGLGDVIVQQLSAYNPEAIIFTPSRKAELLTNVELFHAKNAIAYKRHELPDQSGSVWSFEDELRSARWDDNNRCDSLMALALALWPLRKRSSPMILPRIGKV